jgi:hypothetical protein
MEVGGRSKRGAASHGSRRRLTGWPATGSWLAAGEGGGRGKPKPSLIPC